MLVYPVRCSCSISILIIVHRKEIYMHHIHRQQGRSPNNVAGVIFPDVAQKFHIVGWMSIHRTVRKNISYMCVCVFVCVCVCVCMYACLYTYTYTHTHTHTHTTKQKINVIFVNSDIHFQFNRCM